jgi:signal transduction histidine kinase
MVFARPSGPALAKVPASQMLREVQTLMAPSLEKNNIHRVVEESEPVVLSIDIQQVKQVFIHLVRKAAGRGGQNGSITLRAREDPPWPGKYDPAY